jgi:hypothetical protein
VPRALILNLRLRELSRMAANCSCRFQLLDKYSDGFAGRLLCRQGKLIANGFFIIAYVNGGFRFRVVQLTQILKRSSSTRQRSFGVIDEYAGLGRHLIKSKCRLAFLLLSVDLAPEAV